MFRPMDPVLAMQAAIKEHDSIAAITILAELDKSQLTTLIAEAKASATILGLLIDEHARRIKPPILHRTAHVPCISTAKSTASDALVERTELAILLKPFREDRIHTVAVSALSYAIKIYQGVITKLVINARSYPHPHSREQKNLALIAAAKQGHLEAILALLKSGADVNAQVEGITPLMAAALPESTEAIGSTELNKGIKTATLLMQHGARLYQPLLILPDPAYPVDPTKPDPYYPYTYSVVNFLLAADYPTPLRPAIRYFYAALQLAYTEARDARLSIGPAP